VAGIVSPAASAGGCHDRFSALATDAKSSTDLFDVVPADRDPKAQPPAGKQVYIRSLPSNERSRSLREDEDAGGELDSLSNAGEIGEHPRFTRVWDTDSGGAL
jgi:hypothetical protein